MPVGKECVQLVAGTTAVVLLQVLEEPKQRVEWQSVAMAFEDTLNKYAVYFFAVVLHRVLGHFERTTKILGQCDARVDQLDDFCFGSTCPNRIQDSVEVAVGCG
ncbi:MAG: hypothetical protein EBY83_03950 [Verrucomicrobia bacterium]|nr:hypothetical protein [Verrucomicrobiota bacterium]